MNKNAFWKNIIWEQIPIGMLSPRQAHSIAFYFPIVSLFFGQKNGQN